uniref:Mastoparan-C n=1 Tax=Vespa crabro TaxID=7445 RepID=MAST_VESCR|nr:RecName: Full=Mastoparan-C; Short=MP-C [Vespa crabro]
LNLKALLAVAKKIL